MTPDTLVHALKTPPSTSLLRRHSTQVFPRGILTVAAAVLVAVASFSSVDAAAPANNNFNNAILLSGASPSSAPGATNVEANKESGEPDPLGIGGNSVWWKWTAPAAVRVEINTFTSAIDTVLYVFTGSAVNNLTTIAIGDHANGDDKARVYFTANAGTTYHIAVHGARDINVLGSVSDEGAIKLNIVSPAPLAAPANDNFANRLSLTPVSYPFQRMGDANAGATVEYLAEPLVLQKGAASVWYSWTAPTAPAAAQYVIDTLGSGFDTMLHVFTGTSFATLVPVAADDDFNGETKSRVILNVPANTSVTYEISVLGYLGETGSIKLNISKPSPALVSHANDNFANRESIYLNMADSVATTNATIEPYETYPLELGGASVWWTWTAPAGVPPYVKISTASSNFDTVLYVFTGTGLGNLSLIASSDDAEGSLQGIVNIPALQGQVFQIAVHGWKGLTGNAGLMVTPGVAPPSYNSFANEKDLGKHRSTTKVFNSGSTSGNIGCDIEPGEDSLLQSSSFPDSGASAWFKFTADISANYTVNTVGSNFNTVLYVYEEKANMKDLVEIAANNDTGSGGTSQVAFDATKDKKYLLAVSGYLGSTGSNITINIASGATKPFNDDFGASRGNIVGYSSTTGTNSNVGATVEPFEDPAIEDPEEIGGKSVWWDWTAPGTPGGPPFWVDINTLLSDFDTVLYVFEGFEGSDFYSDLIPVAFGDDTDGDVQSRVNFLASPGTPYYISVQGFNGDSGAITLTTAPGTPAPLNDHFASPDTSLGSLATASAMGSNIGAGVEHFEPDPLNGGGASVWWTWTAPAGVNWVEVNTIGSSFNTLLYVFMQDPMNPGLEDLISVASDNESGGSGRSRLNFQATPGITYYFAVHGDHGKTGNITLQVKPGMPPPSNDHFASRPFLGNGATASVLSGSSIGASSEASEPNPLGTAAASVWWSWQAPVNGWVKIDTFGSAFDTVLYVFTGGASGDISTLNLIAASDDSENTFQSRAHFLAVAGTVYHIALNGRDGRTGIFDLNIAPGFVPPNHNAFSQRIDLLKSKPSTVPPRSWAGSNAGSSLEAIEPDSLVKGGASLWFKWTADESNNYQVNTFGSDIDTVLYLYEDNDDMNLITELGFNDNAEGTLQSRIDFYALDNATFRIAVHGKRDSWGNIKVEVKGGALIPTNDDFNPVTNPQLTGSPGTTSGTNVGASLDLDHTEPDPLGIGDKSVWWKWTPPTSGWYEIDTFGSSFDTLLYVFTSGVALPVFTDLILVDGNDADTSAVDQSRVSFLADHTKTYYLAVHGDEGETGSITLNVKSVPDPPGNDNFATPHILGATPGPANTDTVGNFGATIELFEPDSLDESGRSVWWRFTPMTDGWIEVNTHGSVALSGRDLDTILYVYTGSSLENLTERAFNDSGGGKDTSAVNFHATANTTYHIAVHGDDGDIGSVTVNVITGVDAPDNDHVASATLPPYDLGTALPASTTGSNAGASLQHGEPDSVDDGGASVWWTWTAPAAPATQWIEVNTFGSSFDTLLYVFSGTNFIDFVEEGFNTEADGTLQSAVNFLATANTTYHIAVHGDDARTGSINLAIGAGTSPPANDDFANAAIFPGANSGPFSINLAPVADASIKKSSAAGNFGACDIIQTNTAGGELLGEGRMLLQFDLSSIPEGATVTSAQMTLQKIGGHTESKSVAVHRVTTASTAWNEGIGSCSGTGDPGTGATWTSPWTAAGAQGDYHLTAVASTTVGGNAAYVWNITSLVQQWHNGTHPNRGIIMGSPDSGTVFFDFASRNHATAGLRPVLAVTYTGGTPVGPATGSDSGSNAGAKLQPDEPDPLRDGGASVWWKWRPAASDFVQVNTVGSNFDTILYVFKQGATPAMSDLILVGFSDAAGDSRQSRVNFQATLGDTYYFAVHGDWGATGDVSISIADGIPPPANDNYASSLDLGGNPVVHASNMNEGATLEAGEEALLDASTVFDPYDGPGGASIWYRWQAPSAAPVVVSTLGSQIDTIVYVYTNAGGTLGTLSEVAANDDENSAGGIDTSRVSFTPAAWTTYYIAVHGSDGDTGTINLSLSSLGPLDTWAAKHNLTGAAALANADADKDGISNLKELAFGLNPALNSSLGGNDPNRMNQPQFVKEGGMMKIYYTLDPANLNAGARLPITVTGATSLNLFQTIHANIPPISMGGNSWRVEDPINSPTYPKMQLGVLVTDPN